MEGDSSNSSDPKLDDQVHRVVRRWIWWAAITAILVGIAGLVFRQHHEHAVSLVLGIYFIASGIGRVSTAFDAEASTVRRAVTGGLGAVVIVCGVLCLNNPYHSLTVVDGLVSVALIIDAAACIGVALLSRRGTDRHAALVTATVSAAAAIVIFAVPVETFSTLLTISAACFVIIGLGAVVTLVIANRGFAKNRSN